MTEEIDNKNEGTLQKRSPQEYLTYAKWGLMGIGGLWVAKLVIGTLLSPLGLVGLAGAGAAGAWYFNRSRTSDAVPASDAESMRAEAERQADQELSAVGVPPAPAPPTAPPAGPPAETPMQQFDRLAGELERMKDEMSSD